MLNTTSDLDVVHTAILSPVGIPPFTLRYTYRAILAMEDAGPILARHAANRSTNATTNATTTQQALMDKTLQSA